jgi:hypothetical protein
VPCQWGQVPFIGGSCAHYTGMGCATLARAARSGVRGTSCTLNPIPYTLNPKPRDSDEEEAPDSDEEADEDIDL